MRTPAWIDERRASLAETLAENGLPLTDQRRVVYEALLARDDHPTADLVHQSVRRKLPRISLATVYRTLETLVTLGLVHRVAHPGASARYDANVRRHHHLLCDRCGGMFDVESKHLDAIKLPRLDPEELRVRDYSFQLRGLCRACAKHKPEGST